MSRLLMSFKGYLLKSGEGESCKGDSEGRQRCRALVKTLLSRNLLWTEGERKGPGERE